MASALVGRKRVLLRASSGSPGSGSGGSGYTPSLDFSNTLNSQFLPLVS